MAIKKLLGGEPGGIYITAGNAGGLLYRWVVVCGRMGAAMQPGRGSDA